MPKIKGGITMAVFRIDKIKDYIEYVIDCMKSNTTDIRSIRKYLLAALFNAPSTIGSYYTAKVNHDIYGGGRDEV